jgi:hypothetical protein
MSGMELLRQGVDLGLEIGRMVAAAEGPFFKDMPDLAE